ncbi:LTA synthase family protein [Clostridium cylindrosporum]|uniref:Lipoteichoic acid synthase-like YqgS n=1 Tax=Clostridium cylindrosporum DSM 605 TaxID=1121307 RepID=A0A0J8FZ44_CLOCY|nr:LTA synthase family protein [Clostridium cylindrosporum]KMT20891.1 lipoteichoic acid synthase-like YqgS [Clostridium cylindrosporum DSM 605]
MNSTQKILKNNLDILLFISIIFLKLISSNITLKLNGLSFYTIIGCLGSVLVLLGFSYFFTKRIRIPIFFVINIIVTLIIYIDNVYNRYFLDVTTIGLIKQLGITGEVKDSVFNLITIFDLLYILDLIILIPFYLKNKREITRGELKFNKRVISSISMLIIGFMLSALSVIGLAKMQVGILNSFYDKKAIVREVGLLNYHVLDINKYINNYMLKKSSITEDEKAQVEAFFENKNKTSLNNPKYNGIAKGKNLIVIQLEAFQSFVLNKKINGVEITPNLNKLAKESLNFKNYYFQTSLGGTSDAEFLSNTSLLPAREGSVYYQYAQNEYNSLPKSLKESGYYTAVMHANRPGFWNRQEMYKALGFDTFQSEKNYKIDDVKILGLSDKSFFRQNIEKLKSYPKPFYGFMISLTSHFSFRDEKNSLKDVMNVGEYEGSLVGDYIKTARYTDEALGQFLNDLKKEGLYDNTVIAIYGDHSAISSDKRDQLAKVVYGKETISEFEWQEAQKVVSMIHIPGSNLKGDVDSVAGQYDLYPTLANLFGFKTKVTLGQDLLNKSEGFVVTRAGNFVTDSVIYVKAEDKIYDRKTKKELNKKDYQKYFDKMNEYFTVTDKIIENNLIKVFN